MNKKSQKKFYAKVLRDLGVEFVAAHKAAKRSFKETESLNLRHCDVEIDKSFIVSVENGYDEYFDMWCTVTTCRGKSGKTYTFLNDTLW